MLAPLWALRLVPVWTVPLRWVPLSVRMSVLMVPQLPDQPQPEYLQYELRLLAKRLVF